MNEQAERFFDKNQKWSEEMNALREIVCANKLLEEDFKWMHPCYTFHDKNIVLIHSFKEYCALLFHKGSLLKDAQGLLIQQTENVQAARQLRFTSVQQIHELAPAIADYVNEAIAIEKSGKKVPMKKVADYPVPTEFQRALDDDEALNKAFHALTPGRQKGYLFYFSQAKQAKTREARIEKYYENILAGKGIDDLIK
ncbi:YdeI/OmpD-associated family protein [Parapedobacter sp. 10938]|uniref:YdeI/OmpD-associated family protein n=1 Tax=Parapedobacter flavus TaxID=3110225 RepID=UPI002DBADA58|nr:YdeI/OmpD-associated family protein [Parapedobacter sp. 10938]MEC3878613.1 YdeI/OmpD-associated family protein [Parapedobacter sp. 10938]